MPLTESPDKLTAPAELELVFPSDADCELADKLTRLLELESPGRETDPEPELAYVTLAPWPVAVPKPAPPPDELCPLLA